MDEYTALAFKITSAVTIPVFLITLSMSNIDRAFIVGIIVFIIMGLISCVIAFFMMICDLGEVVVKGAVGATADHLREKQRQNDIEQKEAKDKLAKAFSKKFNVN